MAAKIDTYQCLACTGPLHFGASSGRLECEYCGSAYDVAEVEAFYAKEREQAKLFCPACGVELSGDLTGREAACPKCGVEFEPESLRAYGDAMAEERADSMTWDTQAGGQWQPGETEGLRVYSCNTCGGEIVADETTGATACPYCGNPVVLAGFFEGNLKPDLVIPFQVDKKKAVDILQNHYKGKRLLPKVFKDQNHIQEVKGLYVPVWLFDAEAEANLRCRATRIRSWSDSQYHYTETRHYAVVRGGGIGFQNVPVDGSTKMDDALMESIEPFDISGAVPFKAAYLPGFLADKYDVDADSSIQRANQRIRQSTEDAFRDTIVGYSTITSLDTSIALQNGRAKYALYPVWLLNTRWNGEKFTFAINGQTGRVAGDLPMDRGLFWKYFGIITGAVSAAVFALSFLLLGL